MAEQQNDDAMMAAEAEMMAMEQATNLRRCQPETH